MKSKPAYDVGGQAVIEGVMMKSPTKYSTAVRLENGKIRIQTENFNSVVKKHPKLNIPIIRGIFYLFEMLIIGMKTLSWSANQQSEGEEISNTEIGITIAVSILLSLGIFVVAPFFVTKLFTSDNGMRFNLIDGGLRLVFFLVYVGIVGLFSDIRRVFQYHGAEHKAVNCNEKGMKLTVENVAKCSTLHPRCGTSFLVWVIMISIVLFSFITSPQWYIKLLSRIILIPLIAGISFELLKISAKLKDHPAIRIAVYPGLWVQKLTTREPDEKQIEVAIAAMKSAMR